METSSKASVAIKSATALAHAKTEKALIHHIKCIQTEREYGRLLSCLYAFNAPVEQLLEPWVKPVLADYDERRKSNRLLHDLHTLGLTTPPAYKRLPVIKDLFAALGCFYVLEGSVLGGVIIKKIIREQCPKLPDNAFGFFSGYDQQNGLQWQKFLAQFDSLLNDADKKSAAITAANDCFKQFEANINDFYAWDGN
ncbi:biliverdin-producing heme oxygenase [Niastella koreensis]|uniref:biliverdin-producing heme oxygenase n=1 Tax=Niastella koreensis TaxID=354356 RepID=UPI0013FDE262|nr:biliverdin-producing heme oxygenase [Niastella koreensis]